LNDVFGMKSSSHPLQTQAYPSANFTWKRLIS
jgi:hypothetical protein